MKTLESLITRYQKLLEAQADLAADFAALDLTALPRRPPSTAVPRKPTLPNAERVLDYLTRCKGISSVHAFYRNFHLTADAAFGVIEDLEADGKLVSFSKPLKPGGRKIMWIGLPGQENVIRHGDDNDD